MSSPLSVRWILAGTLAEIGGHFLITLGSRVAGGGSLGLYLLGALASGAVVGALIVRHAVVRSWREPLVVSVLAASLLIGTYVFLGFDATRWMVPRTPDVWPVLLSAAGLGVAGTLGGARLAQRSRVEPTRLGVVLVVSMLVGVGVYVVVALLALSSTTISEHAFEIAIFGGAPLAGFVTQLVVPARQPWACGAGWLVLVPLLALMAARRLNGGTLVLAGAASLLAAVVLAVLGFVGARLAWRWFPTNTPQATPGVASARVRSPE